MFDTNELDVPAAVAQAATDLLFDDYARLGAFAFDVEMTEDGCVVHVAIPETSEAWESSVLDVESSSIHDIAGALLVGMRLLRPPTQSFAELEAVVNGLLEDVAGPNIG